jgi:hypothetical protein
VEDLRHLWNRLLQLEHESQLGGREALSHPRAGVASELILAALGAVAEGPGVPLG